MAVVVWKYNNPYVDTRQLTSRSLLFQGHLLELPEDKEVEVDVTQNTGRKLWDGAYVLARYLESRDFPPGFWNEKACVELGAGCGLVGLVAWLLGARVTLTDMRDTLPHTLRSLQTNVCQVSHRDAAHVRTDVLVWGEDCCHIQTPVDVILGAEIVYRPEHTDDLVSTLETLSTKDTLILISYKKRGFGEDIFFEKMQKNFTCTQPSADMYPRDFEDSMYTLYRFKKK